MKCRIYHKDGTIYEGEWDQAPHYTDSSKIIHREDGPAIECADGTKHWYLDGRLHREDGPAVEWADGTKGWLLNGKLHREDGPAKEYVSGAKAWWLNGKLHREDGPAIEWCDGVKEWWLNGERLKTLSKKYLIRYMELTGECLASLLLSPDKVLRESAKKYEWKELNSANQMLL